MTAEPPVTDVSALLERLAARGHTLAAAESLTGGAFLAMLTELPGASRVVRAGLVVYATDTKATLAGVDPELLARVGPVDPEVARSLALGARRTGQATFGVGITGVAGPQEQDGHPVGEVHVAVAGPSDVVTRSYHFADRGDRQHIRTAACEAAVALLEELSRE